MTKKRLGVSDDDLEIAAAIGRYAETELGPHAQLIDQEEISTVRYVPGLAELG